MDKEWKKKIEEYNKIRNIEVDRIIEENQRLMDKMRNITKECMETCEEIK